jgi:hypothetical protein
VIKLKRNVVVTLGEIIRSITREDQFETDLKLEDQNRVIPWSIYEVEKKDTVKELRKRMKRIHITLKYKWLVPLLILTRRMCGKYLVKEIPRRQYNKNLFIFQKAFDKTCEDWNYYYRCAETEPKQIKKFMEQARNMDKNFIALKDIMMTVISSDAAPYKEFFNFLMFNMTTEMNNVYGKTAHHIPYKSRIMNDVMYYRLLGTNEQNSIFKLPDGRLIAFPAKMGTIMEEVPKCPNFARSVNSKKRKKSKR